MLDVLFDLGPDLILPAVLVLVGYLWGSATERQHFADIRRREARWQHLPAVTFRTVPPDWTVGASGLVVSNVVVSIDQFKRFVSALRSLVGGAVNVYEPLLDRARREAMLRLKERAHEMGYDCLINVRLQSCPIAEKTRQGPAGIELMAVGTGLVTRRPAAT